MEVIYTTPRLEQPPKSSPLMHAGICPGKPAHGQLPSSRQEGFAVSSTKGMDVAGFHATICLEFKSLFSKQKGVHRNRNQAE